MKSHSKQPRSDRAENPKPPLFIERMRREIEARLDELEPIAEEARQLERELAALHRTV